MVVLSFVHLVLMGDYHFFPFVSQSCCWCPNNYPIIPTTIGIIGIIASIIPSIIGTINSINMSIVTSRYSQYWFLAVLFPLLVLFSHDCPMIIPMFDSHYCFLFLVTNNH